ncbi:cation:proton antiporter [Pseudoroseomonas cervicalis]|uniref:cation:proton antiporter n=1 Tax=Teichococcus cervicalis TaxID=204525 RepID=UPI0022F1803F|nr:cation:proton antiporter [Pseudoroseomonas cervicalis]WBV43375.1 cation:proton antiporter [Pseudoroseomonas cervicalis]
MLSSLPDTILALSLLLIVVSAIQPLARRLMLSSTVLLAVVGVLLGAGATFVLNTSRATPLDEVATSLVRLPVNAEVFLFLFLPLLVFHGSLSIDVRRLARDWAPVLVMAVVAVLVTTAAIGFALAPIAGVSLTACLMLGAIVATTDPSAVVGIFREIGANSRLTRLVEGESLLNDAAAISIFTIFLAQLTGDHPAAPLEAAVTFLTSFAGGMAVGFVLARLMLAGLPWLGGNRTAEVTLTLALPYLAYILCDEVFEFSGVVAAAAAGLTVSAIGPSTFRPRSWQFLQDIWDQLSFWASSMVFILASMLVPRLLLGMEQHDLLLIGVVILAAMVARAAVLFGVMPLLLLARLSQRVPVPFKVTILWGGLRGAITLALALAVTENRAVPREVQQFVAIVATGYVLSTLLVNGTTLRFLVRALKLDRLSPADQALRNQVVAIGLGEVRDKLRNTARDYGFSAATTAHVVEMYDHRVKVETAANTFDTAISDRERVTLGLITFASQERSVLLELFQEQGLSRRVMENLLWNAESMIDGARTEGRLGYIQAARRRLQPGLRFHIAQWLHRRFRIDTPLMHCMAERFEMLLLTHLVSVAMARFMRRRMEPVLGTRVTEVVADIVARREDLLEDAMDTLRLQYPGYAEALETRLLRQLGLRLEAEEYATLRQESLVGEELHEELVRGLETLRRQVTRPLQFNIQSGLDQRIAEFPLFAGLQEALRHDLAMSVTSRFVVPGETLYRPRRRARSVFLISRGEVVLTEDGHDTLLTHGDIFGDQEVLRNSRRRGRARAASFCHLLELSAADFHRLLAEAPSLAGRIERRAEKRQESLEKPAADRAPPPPLPALEALPAPPPAARPG